MKKLLLASTALVGASMLAAPALAGTPSVKDDFSVSIGGNVRFSVMWWDQDADNNDRGYGFQTGQSEVSFKARGSSDNLAYGFDIEIQTQTDDTSNSDETWMFIDGGDAWGRIELGDQDDGGDRMFVDGGDATDGGRGISGGVGSILVDNGQDHSGKMSLTSDDSKIIYFTPRFGGFQVGASFTPDAGQSGALDEQDNTGDNENIYSIGANYKGDFNGVGFTIAGVYMGGDNELSTNEDPEVWGVGVNVTYAGFEFGAGYADLNDTDQTVANATAGQDGGQWWDVGLNYKTGPWVVGAGFFTAERDWANNPATGNYESKVFQVGVDYAVAPGWKIESDVNFIELDNYTAAGADNDATVFTFTSTMTF